MGADEGFLPLDSNMGLELLSSVIAYSDGMSGTRIVDRGACEFLGGGIDCCCVGLSAAFLTDVNPAWNLTTLEPVSSSLMRDKCDVEIFPAVIPLPELGPPLPAPAAFAECKASLLGAKALVDVEFLPRNHDDGHSSVVKSIASLSGYGGVRVFLSSVQAFGGFGVIGSCGAIYVAVRSVVDGFVYGPGLHGIGGWSYPDPVLGLPPRPGGNWLFKRRLRPCLRPSPRCSPRQGAHYLPRTLPFGVR